MNNNKRQKLYIKQRSTTITPGANEGYAHDLLSESIHTLIEGIRSEDGINIKVDQILFHIRIYCTEVFSFSPAIVQTAGTFTNQTNLSERIFSSMLNVAIDDVFGYDLIDNHKVARKVPVATEDFGLEFTMSVPRKHLNIINKETETERLQDLLLCIAGVGSNGAGMPYDITTTVRYTEQRKTVILR
jgi:hypothetical protein